MTQLPHHTTAIAALAMVLAGCGATPMSPSSDAEPHTSAPTGLSPTAEPPEPAPLPSGSGKPRNDLPNAKTVKNTPDAVSKAAATTMWSVDTTADVSQHDATVRAIPYATPKYAEQIKNTPQRSAPGAEWNEWADHDAYTEVTLSAANDAGAPADTKTNAYRTWSVTVTPYGENGWIGEPATHTAFVHLTRSGKAPWKVDGVQVQ